MRKAQIRTSPSEPIVKTKLSLEKASAFKRPLKPTAIISGPMLLPGRRLQAYSPVPVNPQPIPRARTA